MLSIPLGFLREKVEEKFQHSLWDHQTSFWLLTTNSVPLDYSSQSENLQKFCSHDWHHTGQHGLHTAPAEIMNIEYNYTVSHISHIWRCDTKKCKLWKYYIHKWITILSTNIPWKIANWKCFWLVQKKGTNPFLKNSTEQQHFIQPLINDV